MTDLDLLRHVLSNATFALFTKESDCAKAERESPLNRTDRVYYARAYHALQHILQEFYDPRYYTMDVETELPDEDILAKAPWLGEFAKAVRAAYNERAEYEKYIAHNPTSPHPGGQWCNFANRPEKGGA